ncbi:MAG: hypothetical protein GXP01_08120, partial [Alphaproteobacteria bacterium]|nr:hypothetical protein [Alphaproteobacteria bacterium]
ISGFTGIDVQSGLKVIATRAETYSVRIEADDEAALEKIEITLRDDVVYIRRNDSFFDFVFDGGFLGMFSSRNDQPIIHISAPDMSSLVASAGARIELDDTAPPDLTIKASSGASIWVGELTTAELTLDLSSGANARLVGVCELATVEFSSGASFSGSDLACTEAYVDGSSGGSATLAVTDEVRGKVSSGASLMLIGTPAAIDVSASSGGSVRVR